MIREAKYITIKEAAELMMVEESKEEIEEVIQTRQRRPRKR